MATAPGLLQPVLTRSDHELVQQVRGGSDRAFEELYARYGSRIRAHVLRMVGDYARAEDITQEAFLSALRRLRGTETPIVFRPWIFEIAKNACIDELRRSRRRGEEVPLGHDPDQLLGAQGSVLPTDAEAENRQRLRDLSGAFRGLSDNHHQVIVLRELEGLSYTQIGQRLGMSRPMVESTLFRARRRLNEEYQDLATGRRCAQVQALLTGEANHALIALGLRQRRKVSRHLAHCQPCRRMARLAGVDERFFRAPSLARRIAGLLPLPWLHHRAAEPAAPAAAPRGRGLGLATRQLESVAPSVDPSAPLAGLGRALTAASTALIAAVGGGYALHSGAGAAAGAVPHAPPALHAPQPPSAPIPPVLAPPGPSASASPIRSPRPAAHTVRSARSTRIGSARGAASAGQTAPGRVHRAPTSSMPSAPPPPAPRSRVPAASGSSPSLPTSGVPASILPVPLPSVRGIVSHPAATLLQPVQQSLGQLGPVAANSQMMVPQLLHDGTT